MNEVEVTQAGGTKVKVKVDGVFVSLPPDEMRRVLSDLETALH